MFLEEEERHDACRDQRAGRKHSGPERRRQFHAPKDDDGPDDNKQDVRKGVAELADEDTAEGFRSAMIGGEQGGFGDLATERGSGSKVVDGVTGHANPKE